MILVIFAFLLTLGLWGFCLSAIIISLLRGIPLHWFTSILALFLVQTAVLSISIMNVFKALEVLA